MSGGGEDCFLCDICHAPRQRLSSLANMAYWTGAREYHFQVWPMPDGRVIEVCYKCCLIIRELVHRGLMVAPNTRALFEAAGYEIIVEKSLQKGAFSVRRQDKGRRGVFYCNDEEDE